MIPTPTIVQVVQAVSEGIEELRFFGRFVEVYFDPFMPLLFK